MAVLTYIKGIRTRLRNTLNSEISMAKDLLTSEFDEKNFNEVKVNEQNVLKN